MRRIVATGVGLVATFGTIGVAAPAQAAETAAKPFNLTYGASYYTGSVTFSSRSVTATGLLHSVAGSGCRWVSVVPYAGTTAYPGTFLNVGQCNGASDTATVGATIDLPGGPTSVVVGLWTSNDDGSNLTLVRTTSKIAR
ncbi:hypothetical protein EV643_1553 [Kribbella sp. VKM Ac-2527]|uniref:Uncharacterized protein n=1 Tax=Kribbella caucasensis TaxID=2512215 RepID=A0A4R6IYV9_9ACTN|nr:hypothetical protein [Kribbella sp. VKM Ac-2527]TDO27647.1 hypothetical protein EV643_1553 [Kribbella sp. VKM Ac-2527]